MFLCLRLLQSSDQSCITCIYIYIILHQFNSSIDPTVHFQDWDWNAEFFFEGCCQLPSWNENMWAEGGGAGIWRHVLHVCFCVHGCVQREGSETSFWHARIDSFTCHRFCVCQGGVKRLDATFAVAPRGHGAEEFHSWLKASRHPWADRLPDAIYHEHVVCEGVEAIKSVVMSSLRTLWKVIQVFQVFQVIPFRDYIYL